MKYHLQAWEETVSKHGSDLKGEQLSKQVYGKNTEILERILGKHRFSEDELKNIAAEKDELYRKLYLPHLKLLPGLMEFLEHAKTQGIVLAIATGGTIENVHFVVDQLNIRFFFSTIVCGADVKYSKPDPETFLKAAKQLDVLPSDCIVFEDVPMGVEAAKRAGMKAVIVLTSHKIEDFTSFRNVLKTISDYTTLDIKELN